MAEVDASLLLDHLKRIQDRLGRLEDGQQTIIQRLNAVSSHMAGFMANDVVQDTTIASLAARLERVERRLDLRDEA